MRLIVPTHCSLLAAYYSLPTTYLEAGEARDAVWLVCGDGQVRLRAVRLSDRLEGVPVLDVHNEELIFDLREGVGLLLILAVLVAQLARESDGDLSVS